ncbi:MAG: Crp/Fnr family transcriptional regulator [Pseudonocardiales bacterium]|nr:Crp/Fnr family transcriptional regulator [Pseudonocardiales bacterium]MBV9032191.1 Crp/Fnr family transcriptional regulator [Pseudonocardiales bacterium]MBW0011449.1 Crp/Fnr family transcriptional regulator [Pseudonocardiales bacterium]
MDFPTNDTAAHDNGEEHGEWGSQTFVGRLQPAERRALLALGAPTLHPVGAHLLMRGDRSRFVLVLHAGPVKVVVHDTAGREHLLGLRGRGDLLGELSYLDSQPRSASVVTLCPVSVTTICPERFGHFLEEYPRVGIELTRCVGERLRDADRSRLELSADDVALRVTRLLRSLAHGSMAGSPRRGAVIPLTQGQLAQLANASEVAVQRILRDFRARGMVRTAYRSVEVPCLTCLDLLLAELSGERPDRRGVRGCGGHESHHAR